MEAESREKLVPDLRKESRRKYLTKRKDDKLNELKDDIMDDEFLFDEDQLTEKEKAERRYKKKVLELAVEHSRAGEIEKVQRYHMPEDRKEAKDKKYFDEAEEREKLPNYEQKRWEEEHLHSAQFRLLYFSYPKPSFKL
jgi:pre-mRNA-splicing factor ATP-dependent RNA helicase DHX16